jgi:hypothetical protein
MASPSKVRGYTAEKRKDVPGPNARVPKPTNSKIRRAIAASLDSNKKDDSSKKETNVMTTLQERLEDICKQTEDSEHEVHFRNDYSGRGMSGRSCVGITGSRRGCMQVIAEVIKQAATDMVDNIENPGTELKFDEMIDTLLGFDQDSMGYDIIMYWSDLPSIDSAGELSDREG